MTLSLVLSAVFLVWIVFDQKRKTSVGEAILSPIFYFSALWFFAFPVHAWLLDQGLVDTQQVVRLNQSDLTAAVWLSMASLLVVYWSARKAQPCRPKHSTAPNVDGGAEQRRVLFWLLALIALSGVFLTQTVFVSGSFSHLSGNEQNELRVGSGPLFLLSELFIYGLIAAIPVLLEPGRWRSVRVMLTLVFAVGLVLAVVVGVVLTSRRIIVLPLFALALAWLYTFRKGSQLHAALAAALLASTVVAAPALQSLRYALTPPAATSKEFADNGVIGYCRWIGETPAPQKAVTIQDASGGERAISGVSARVAKEFCDTSNYSVYLSVQLIASSYGLADHLATFLNKASPSELLLGVDYGVAWSYNIALALVPRSIWNHKPLHYGSVATQKWLYPEMFKDKPVTMTLPPSFIVDFLYGFGLLSLFILCFGLGRLLAWVQVGLFHGLGCDNRVRFIISLFLMAYMFNVVRGGTGFVQALIPMLAVTTLMYGIVRWRGSVWGSRRSRA